LLSLLNLPIAATPARSDLRGVFRLGVSVVGERLLVVVVGGAGESSLVLRGRGPELEVDKKRCTSSGSGK
jgi:hypothetical protein